MTTGKSGESDEVLFTEEGRLRHENRFLKERVENLETFKKNFFKQQNDLIEAREKIAGLQQQLNMDRLKERIMDVSETVDDAGAAKGRNEDILEFFHESISATSYQDLIMSIFQSADGLGLDMAVQIRNRKNVLNFCLDQSHKKDSIALISRHLDDGEVVELDGVIIINHTNLSLMARGLPVDKPVRNQQLKEYLEIIAVGANTRIDTMARSLELEELQANIYKIFRRTNQSFESIQDSMDNQVIAISELFIKCEKHLQDTLARLKVSEEHRKLIHLIIADARSELNLLLTSSLTMDEHFVSVMKKLEKAYAPERHDHHEDD